MNFYNEKYNLLQLSGIKYLISVHNIKQNLSNLLIITNNHNIPINHSKNFPNEKFDIFLFENSDYTKIENKELIEKFKNNKTINNLFNYFLEKDFTKILNTKVSKKYDNIICRESDSFSVHFILFILN